MFRSTLGTITLFLAMLMPTSNSMRSVTEILAPLTALAIFIGSCSIYNPNPPADPMLESAILVKFQSLPKLAGGIPFSLGYDATGQSAETLHFFLTKSGDAVVTRYLGPGGFSPIRFSLQTIQDDSGFALICQVRGSDYSPTLARWNLGISGQAKNVSIRTKPILEWRKVAKISATGTLASTSVAEWRPLNDKGDSGVGNWRRQ